MTQPNRHPTTGVRYSIYHINNGLHHDVWDDIYQYGTNVTLRDWRLDLEKRIAKALLELPDDVLRHINLSDTASEIAESVEYNDGIPEFDEPVYEGTTDGIHWSLMWLGGAPHLVVMESPCFGVGLECSPCVPGALDGSSVTALFRDESAAEANRYYQSQDSDRRTCVGYALPGTWLRNQED